MGLNFKQLANINAIVTTLVGTALIATGYGAVGGYYILIAGVAMQMATADAWEKKPDSPAMSGHRMNTRSSRQPLKLIYGKCEVGCNKTFYHVANPYLHIICEIGEGTIDGIVRVDGSIYNTTGTEIPRENTPLIYFDEKLWTEYVFYGADGNGHPDYGDVTYPVYMEFFDGAPSQSICSTLQTATGGKWDQPLKYTSYLYVRLLFNHEIFKKEPDISIVINGLECTDPIAATTAWTDNPALHAYDIITRSSQRGGIGIDAARVHAASLEASRDYCTAKGWKCNFALGEQRPVSDQLEQIISTFRGAVVYSEGVFKILYMDTVANHYEATILSFDESDTVAGSLSISMPDITERYNAVRITYLDQGKNYKPNDYTFSSETDVTADGDYRELAVSLYGITDINLVQRMANYLLESNRLRKTVSVVLGERAKRLEPNDLIYLTHSMPGWTSQLLRIQSATINADETVSISAVTESATLYDDAYNVTTSDYSTTDLLDPSAYPPEVANVVVTETVYSYRLRSGSRLDVTFDLPANYPWFEHVEVWLSQNNSDWAHQFNARESFTIDPVEEGKTYYIKLVSCNVFGTRARFSTAPSYSKYIDGKSDTAPTSLSALTAVITGTALNIYADRLTDDDIELYEFRLGASWAGGVFLASQRSPNLSLNGVKPGTHTVWANTLGTNALYGDTPVSISVDIPEPPRGWTLSSTFVATTAGTYSSAIDYLYNTSHYIQVDHASANLVGSYASTIFDTTTSKQYLAYISADYTVIGTGSLWSDLFPTTGTKWQDVFSTSKTWAEAFSPDAAPSIRMKLQYGATTALGSTLERLEILSGIVTGRYFKAVIDITDPQPSIYGIVQLPTIKLAT